MTAERIEVGLPEGRVLEALSEGDPDGVLHLLTIAKGARSGGAV